jgi:hypothetical protein
MSGAMNDSHRRGDDGRRDEDRRRIDGTLEQRLPSGTFSRVGALPGPPRHHVAVLLGPSSASTRAAAGLLTAPRLPAHSMPWRRRWLRHAFAARRWSRLCTQPSALRSSLVCCRHGRNRAVLAAHRLAVPSACPCNPASPRSLPAPPAATKNPSVRSVRSGNPVHAGAFL